MSCCVVSCHVTSRHLTSLFIVCYITPHYVLLPYSRVWSSVHGIPDKTGTSYIPAEAKVVPCEGGTGSCIKAHVNAGADAHMPCHKALKTVQQNQ